MMSLTAQPRLSLIWQDLEILCPVQIITLMLKKMCILDRSVPMAFQRNPTFATNLQLFKFWLGAASGGDI